MNALLNTLLLMNFVGPEMLIILFVILLLFGGKKIPELMRGMGKGIGEFNKARESVSKEIKEGIKEVKDQEKIKIQEDSQ